jgi:signal transduction histidine kinase/CheY-like chemotaxis protein
MTNMLGAFFDESYAPHGYCLLWQPELIWTHVVADSLIALAYFSIPIALISFVRRRQDIVYSWIFWLFALFIMACGTTHIMAIWTLWNGNYGLEAIIKIITALASVATAIVLWPLIPKALALPSPARLSAVNADLERMVAERDRAIADLEEQSRQRERAEAALVQSQKLEAIGQLTGGIAHDFNNLLQAIAGSLELTLNRPDDVNRVTRWSQNALKAVEAGKSLTNRLLAFSRVQKLELKPIRVVALIEGMAEMIERSLGPMIKLEIASDDAGDGVIGDRTQLELAILNLAINARDAMPDGGTLTISTAARSGKVHPELDAGDYLELSVTDTGIGMDVETLQRAFEPFFTTKGTGKGTGLGLSMVFGVITQSGGAVAIESKAGEGTIVRMFLRSVAEGAMPADEVGSGARSAGTDLAGRTVLLIDDDERVREVMMDALADAGAEVVTAANGEEGLERFAGQKPDLVIVDFAMPGMNGAEVARRVRAVDAKLPVLIVSGFAQSASLAELTGPDVDLLRKPFSNSDFLKVAERLLSKAA